MGSTIYIDQSTMESAVGVILGHDTKAVFTGLEVRTETDHPLLAEFSRLCGLDFFLKEPEISLYAVPYLSVFAADGRGGWFAFTQDGRDGPIYHISQDLTPRLAAESYAAFFNLTATNPDWRQKVLPGSWPHLPEDPEGREKLKEALSPPLPPEEVKAPCPLPRVFPSRAEAEKEFSILDLWTVLRDSRSPRFQVHSMMSPADREGRAIVHYQAWQETYAGLMPESVLAAHTLEHCRKSANGFANSANTFVALDRENGDRVVGFGTLSYHAREFVSVPDAGEVTALYVLEEFQGHGIGRDLLEHCLAWLPRPRTALFVLKGNDKAIGFYEHMGFRLTGHEITQDRMTELEMVRESTSNHNAP